MTMYLNGQWMDPEDATVSVMDRGFLFGHGVYEVVRFFDGISIGMDEHIRRLQHSLDVARIRGADASQLATVGAELVKRTGMPNASIYFQITAGTESVRHHIPQPDTTPTVMAFAQPVPDVDGCRDLKVFSAKICPDLRWHRCDIKSTNLLANIMAKIDATAAGMTEAILHRDGLISEGTSTTVLAVYGDEIVSTPNSSDGNSILPGITRELIERSGTRITSRTLTVEEFRQADEIMLLGTRTMVVAVTSLDGSPVGSGQPGPHANAVLQRLCDWIASEVAAASIKAG